MELTELWLRLMAAPGLGPKRIEQLISHIKPEQLAQASDAELVTLKLTGTQREVLRYGSSAVEASFKWLERSSAHHLLTLSDAAYPSRLRQIAAPPVGLFCVGNPAYLAMPQIAIVGSRQASFSARAQTKRLAGELAASGMVVTSGLALGIDGAAHQGALAEGGSIAVMATGPDRIYPARHRALAEQLVAQGALVSEFLPGTPPRANLFPRRNRLISGLSLGVVVIEAALKSGSLITAHYALEQNREVFALPGNIDNPLTAGPHQLIQQGAKLITNAADIFEELGGIFAERLDKLNPDQDNISQQQLPRDGLLDNVGYEVTSVDQVVERSLLPVDEVVRRLIELELLGEIAAVSGGYVRLRRNH